MKKLLLVSLLLLPTLVQAQAPTPQTRPTLYDEKADGAQQIEKALAEAKKGKKTVLLQFGANWCGWCHKLHKLCETDKTLAAELKKNFVVVLIDIDKKHNADINERYGNPIQHGLPVIVVLDSTGKQLFTQDTGKLEEGDHHSPVKVLAFLKQWAPKR